MDEPQAPKMQTPIEEPQLRSYYPPPNEAFLILFASLAATLSIGIFLVKLGSVGFVLSETLFIIPPLIYLKVKKYPLLQCLRWNGVSLKVIVATLAIGLALVVLLDEIDRLFNLIYPMPQEIQDSLNEFLKLQTWQDYLIIGVGVIIIAALCEESLFRGFLQLSLEAHGSITRAVLFGALLFALAHFNPWWMVQILLLGVFLGYVSWRSNSAIPGMLIHGLNNGLALFSNGTSPGTPSGWYNLGNHVAPTVLIAALALFFIGFKFFSRFTEEPLATAVSSHDTSAS